MSVANYQDERTAFDAVYELPEEERPGFLKDLAGNQPELAARVRQMLEQQAKAETFFGCVGEESQPSFEPMPPDPAGTQVGEYELMDLIGEGAMGMVYRARQTQGLERMVALKIMRPGLDTRQAVARFELERQTLAQMSHQGIAKVFDAGATSSGRPYFVMEYIEGESIGAYSDARGLKLNERLHLFLEVCAAIQHAHQKGVIHRDLKPSNVLVMEREGKAVPVVIDFGIAKAMDAGQKQGTMLTQGALFLGTPDYMPPEQAEGATEQVDTRADVYALGAILFELLVGSSPFAGHGLTKMPTLEMVTFIRESQPPTPSRALLALDDDSIQRREKATSTPQSRWRADVRGDLDWIVARCMEKEPERRYNSVDALARDVERHLLNEPVLAGPPSWRYQARKFVQRNRSATVAVAGVVAAIGLGTLVSVWQAVRATRAEKRAEAELAQSQKMTEFLSDTLYVGGAERFEPKVTLGEVLGQSAERVEETFADDTPTRVTMLLKLAQSHASLNQHEQSLQAAKRALASIESDPGLDHGLWQEATVLAMRASSSLGRDEDAIRIAEQMEADPAADSDTLMGLRFQKAVALLKLGRLDQARAVWEALSSSLPSPSSETFADKWLVEIRLAGVDLAQKRWQDAGERLEQMRGEMAAWIDPWSDRDLHWHALFSEALEKQGRAEVAVEEVLKLVEDFYQLHRRKQRVWLTKRTHVLRLFRFLGRHVPPAELRALGQSANLPDREYRGDSPADALRFHRALNIAVALGAAEEWVGVQEVLEPYMTAAPENLDPLAPLTREAVLPYGRSLVQLGRYEEALHWLTLASTWSIAAGVPNIDIRLLLAKSHAGLGDRDSTLRICEEGLANEESSTANRLHFLDVGATMLGNEQHPNRVIAWLEPQFDWLASAATDYKQARFLLESLAKAYEASDQEERAAETRSLIRESRASGRK